MEDIEKLAERIQPVTECDDSGHLSEYYIDRFKELTNWLSEQERQLKNSAENRDETLRTYDIGKLNGKLEQVRMTALWIRNHVTMPPSKR